MIRVTILILLLTIALSAISTSEQGLVIRFPQQTLKPYCQNAYSMAQVQQENRLFIQRSGQFNWIKTDTTHFVKSVILSINNNKAPLNTIVSDALSDVITYITPLILLGFIFAAMAIYWLYGLLGPFGSHKNHEHIPKNKNYGMSRRTKIGLIGVGSCALLVCFVGIQGMWHSQDIRQTIISLSCALTKQDHLGFIRNERDPSKFDGGPLQFAQQINLFHNFSKTHFDTLGSLSKLTKVRQLSVKTSEVVSRYGKHEQTTPILQDLNSTATQIKHIGAVIRDLPDKVRTFNDTIQYVRQVMYGFKLFIGNFDKFFTRYIGFDSLSNFFPRLNALSLALIAMVAVMSAGVIMWVSLAQSHDHGHWRIGSQYFLGICFVIALTTAVVSSLLIPFLYANKDYQNYLLSKQFRVGRNINRYLQQIITHFFPNAQGGVWHYYDGKLLNDLQYLQHQLGVLDVKTFQFIQKQAQKSLQQDQSPLIQQIQQLKAIIDDQTIQLVQNARTSVSQLIYQMQDPQGMIGRIQTKALGKNIYYMLVDLRHALMNRMYQARQIYSRIALLLFAALLFTACVEEVQREIKFEKIAAMTEVELQEQEVTPPQPTHQEEEGVKFAQQKQ